jgi:hypothetical protein
LWSQEFLKVLSLWHVYTTTFKAWTRMLISKCSSTGRTMVNVRHYCALLLSWCKLKKTAHRSDHSPETGAALIVQHSWESEDYRIVSQYFVCFKMLIARRVAERHRCKAVLSHRDTSSSCNNKQSVPQRIITVVSPTRVFPFINSHHATCENMRVM